VRACSGVCCLAFDAVVAVALTDSGHSPIVRSGTTFNTDDTFCDAFSAWTVVEPFFVAQQS
jgi:hypothetical protein